MQTSINKTMEEKRIVLRNEQKEHVNTMMKIINQFNIVLDNSPLGSGKTYTALSVYSKLNLKNLIYISTGTILEQVKKILSEHNIENVTLITYESLRSKSGCKPKHGLLEREDKKIERKMTPVFTPTQKLLNLITEGVLIVIDEIQYVKNCNSAQSIAVSAMVKPILNGDTKSKVIELSGLHAHKAEHFISLMQRYCIIKSQKLVNNRTTEQKYIGLQELIDFCKEHNPVLTTLILNSGESELRDSKNLKRLCFTLYNQVVQPVISCSMNSPTIGESVSLDVKNGYYQLSPLDNKYIQKSVKKLYVESLSKDSKIKKYSTSLQEIEVSKINMMIRLARGILDSNPSAKIVFGLWYSKTIQLLKDNLTSYGCITLTGNIKAQDKIQLIQSFNRPTEDFRVLIANMKIVNVGVNLDDRNGEYPRYVFASPSYYYIETHQFTYRFLRGIDTKSSTKIRFLYGTGTQLEESILDALSKASEITNLTLEKQVISGVKFPGSYEKDIEEKIELIGEGPYDIGAILKDLDNEVKEDEEQESQNITEEAKVENSIPISKCEEDEEEEEDEYMSNRRGTPILIKVGRR